MSTPDPSSPDSLESSEGGAREAGAAPSFFLPAGRKRPGSAGVDWLREAWHQFAGNPLGWIGAALIVDLGVRLLSLVPVIGEIATQMVDCVLAGGIVLGCAKRRDGGHFEFADLFSAANEFGRPLLVMGVMFGGASLLYDVIVNHLFGIGGNSFTVSSLSSLDLLEGSPVASLGYITAVLLWWLVLSMAAWFAPALVVLHGVAPADAIVASFRACIANVVPLTVVSVLGFVLFVLGALPLFLGWLVFLPMWLSINYISTVDVFEEPGASA